MATLEGQCAQVTLPFTCIYCRQSHPEVMPSEAHIFPDVIGGVTSTKDTVCQACNHTINQGVEMPARPAFDFFRNFLGIRGRRGPIPRLRATLRVNQYQGCVRLDQQGQPTQPIVSTERDTAGRKMYTVAGQREAAEAKRQEIAQKHPALQWSRHPVRIFESEVRYEVDPTAISLRRLATKVAFERWAQLRGSATLTAPEFDTARAFILTGTEQEACCGVLGEWRLLNGPLNFPPPYHAVGIIAHPNDHILGAFVAFFSLFYYWVILSRQYQALAPWDDCLLEHPQTGNVQQPLLRGSVGSVRVPWQTLEQAFHANPLAIKGVASKYATQKFTAYQRRIYGYH